jgi:hypothetical protein
MEPLNDSPDFDPYNDRDDRVIAAAFDRCYDVSRRGVRCDLVAGHVGNHWHREKGLTDVWAGYTEIRIVANDE